MKMYKTWDEFVLNIFSTLALREFNSLASPDTCTCDK